MLFFQGINLHIRIIKETPDIWYIVIVMIYVFVFMIVSTEPQSIVLQDDYHLLLFTVFLYLQFWM